MREITPQELNDRELIITLMQRHLIKAVTIFPATKTVERQVGDSGHNQEVT